MMYIALKWLLVLTLFMWITLCFIDIFMNRFIDDKSSDQTLWLSKMVAKNNTTPVVSTKSQKERKFRGYPHRHCDVALLHYLLFFSGALAGAIYNKKKVLLFYTQIKCASIVTTVSELLNNFRHLHSNISLAKLNITAIKFGVAILEILLKLWKFSKNAIFKYPNKSKKHETCYTLNLLLLKKVKEIAEEGKKLSRILIATIEANKTLKMRNKVQEIAKSRLVRHIEDVQRQIKESRAKHNAFQQLHMLSQQENRFLKARVTKLQEEKNDAQKNLMSLVDLIYLSKNNDLQAYCNRYIVHSNYNVASSNVTAEIQRILGRIRPETSTSGKKSAERPSVRVKGTKSWTNTRITEPIPEEESLVLMKPDGPKLRGLPGEYVWTVKDKNGLIEKLYEYEYGYNLHSLDTIQRIREYSVYHDKDCLLDFTKCTQDPSGHRFLTESRPFLDFLKNNSENLVSTTTCPRPHLKLLSG